MLIFTEYKLLSMEKDGYIQKVQYTFHCGALGKW
jgi:hypothetical protein